jgi:hypothetical protein
MQPFYRFDPTGGNSGESKLDRHSAASHFSIALRRCGNHAANLAPSLPRNWSIGPIRSYDLPLDPSRFKLRCMSISLATACFALLAAVLHFVSYKLKKTAEKKSFHV